jgi:hypothetical protein
MAPTSAAMASTSDEKPVPPLGKVVLPPSSSTYSEKEA